MFILGEKFKLCQSIGTFCLESSTNKKAPNIGKEKVFRDHVTSYLKSFVLQREGLHLWYVPETAIMQIIEFKSLSLEPLDIVSLWWSVWHQAVTRYTAQNNKFCSTDTRFFIKQWLIFFFLKYPVRYALLLQCAAQKFTNMFFERL